MRKAATAGMGKKKEAWNTAKQDSQKLNNNILRQREAKTMRCRCIGALSERLLAEKMKYPDDR